MPQEVEEPVGVVLVLKVMVEVLISILIMADILSKLDHLLPLTQEVVVVEVVKVIRPAELVAQES